MRKERLFETNLYRTRNDYYSAMVRRRPGQGPAARLALCKGHTSRYWSASHLARSRAARAQVHKESFFPAGTDDWRTRGRDSPRTSISRLAFVRMTTSRASRTARIDAQLSVMEFFVNALEKGSSYENKFHVCSTENVDEIAGGTVKTSEFAP